VDFGLQTGILYRYEIVGVLSPLYLPGAALSSAGFEIFSRFWFIVF